MRYTLFIKCPDVAYDFYESNDKDAHLAEAKRLAEKHPEATITVCDRLEDVMLFQRENGRGGPCNFSLSGMFL